jgi:hypothetical protein
MCKMGVQNWWWSYVEIENFRYRYRPKFQFKIQTKTEIFFFIFTTIYHKTRKEYISLNDNMKFFFVFKNLSILTELV